MSYLTAITAVHTAISVVAIVAGAVAILGMLQNGAFRFWTKLFLVTAVVTSVTGFFFPLKGITPAQIVGVLALIILAVVLVAFYRFHVAKAWRWIYAAGMVASLYLLVFVGVAQAFQKIAFLNGLASTGSELPFLIAQGATLVLFIGFGIAAAMRYHPQVSWEPSDDAAAGVREGRPHGPANHGRLHQSSTCGPNSTGSLAHKRADQITVGLGMSGFATRCLGPDLPLS